MRNLVLPAPPPNMDSFAPEFCFCGKKTVQSHDFWFCSVECARLDSLRSLDDPECHYRAGVRKAYVRAGVPELYPRRMMSVGQLRPSPPGQPGLANAPPRALSPMRPPLQNNVALPRRGAHDLNMAGLPTLSQVTSQVVSKKAAAGESLVAEKHDRPRLQGFLNAPSRTNRVQSPQDHTFEQISLDAIPLPEHVPTRPLRRVPRSSVGLKDNVKKSVTALLNISRRGKEDENPQIVFGHAMNVITPPVRKESLPSHRQSKSPSAIPTPNAKALRRSASFAGWDMTPHSSPSNKQNTLMHIVKEMREDYTKSFDPRSLFDEEGY